jgi:phospholipid/cholesterol/gamma-HCH transport system substrate-binding protein
MGVAALLFLALKVADANSGKIGRSYVLTAHFSNVGGLKVRAPVKSSGVVVGRVEQIGLDKTRYDALVTLKIDERYTFPKDTIATINTSGLLGEQYLGLEPGADDEELKPDDVIKKTQSAVVLEKLIGQFMLNRAEGN